VSDEDSWESLVIWPCHILSGNLEIPGKTQFGHVFFIIEVTDPQLLQRNMAKISLTRYLEYCEPYKENMAKLSLARNFQVSR
jgi:hypothetical protein